jgi:uncharacterized protein YegJ (DUF2314 family)
LEAILKKLLVAMTAFTLVAAVYANEKAQDRTVLIKNQDQEMNAAIAKAQTTLDDFLKVNKNPPQGASGFKLKVLISDSNGSEHMWVTPFREIGGAFVGILADEPVFVRSVTNGQKLTFQRKDISDWGYVQDGKQKGSFTVCVVFKHMPPAEVQRYKDDYGFECRA